MSLLGYTPLSQTEYQDEDISSWNSASQYDQASLLDDDDTPPITPMKHQFSGKHCDPCRSLRRPELTLNQVYKEGKQDPPSARLAPALSNPITTVAQSEGEWSALIRQCREAAQQEATDHTSGFCEGNSDTIGSVKKSPTSALFQTSPGLRRRPSVMTKGRL